jgi:hypothetical protein
MNDVKLRVVPLGKRQRESERGFVRRRKVERTHD